MFVGSCLFRLYIPSSDSLKDKRQVVRSLLQRVRNKFEVAIAEVGENESRRSAILGMASVSNEPSHAEQIVTAALSFIESTRPDCEVAVRSREVTHITDRS